MSNISAWPHYPTARAVIPSGVDPANPQGWTDNLDLIQSAVNSKQDKPVLAGAEGQVLTFMSGAPTWSSASAEPARVARMRASFL